VWEDCSHICTQENLRGPTHSPAVHSISHRVMESTAGGVLAGAPRILQKTKKIKIRVKTMI
jgi:hypothetical protein